MTPGIVLEPKNNNGVVEVWSSTRLPFEPKGELLQLRKMVCAANTQLNCDSDQVLYGMYASSVRDYFDVENILLYNVGQGCFSRSAQWGIRFERVFSDPPPAPRQMSNADHYCQYKLARKEDGFAHWQASKPLVRWNVEQRSTVPLKSQTVWYSMKSNQKNFEFGSERTSFQFGLSITIRFPPRKNYHNFAGLAKPIIDGVVAAFSNHDGSNGRELSRLLGSSLGKDEDEIYEYLHKGKAVLGTRRLLWAFRGGFQFNPADEYCVACELLYGGDSEDDSYQLSGELFAVVENAGKPVHNSR